MKDEELMWLCLGVVVLLAWKRSANQGSTDAVTQLANQEAQTLAMLGGTNWTNSVWDPVNGQPGYMFGTVPVPTSDSSALTGSTSNAGIFGAFP